ETFGERVVTGAEDGSVFLRDRDRADPARQWKVGAAVRCLARGPADALAIGDDSGLITLHHLTGGRQGRLFRGHRGPVCWLALASEGKPLISHSLDGTLVNWDVATGRELHRAGTHRLAVHSPFLTGDGCRVGVVYSEHEQDDRRAATFVRYWDLPNLD